MTLNFILFCSYFPSALITGHHSRLILGMGFLNAGQALLQSSSVPTVNLLVCYHI